MQPKAPTRRAQRRGGGSSLRRVTRFLSVLLLLAFVASMATVAAATASASAERRDLYEVLGVERNATARALRTAYRRLALEHHPDQGGCEETMARLNHARDVLCDPVARRNHDRELDNL